MPGDGILSHIDDTLAERCACGCGRSLTDSPSAWYATERCQQRYLSRQAIDPDDVYQRPAGETPRGLVALMRSSAESFLVAQGEQATLAGRPDPRTPPMFIRQFADLIAERLSAENPGVEVYWG